MKKFIAILMSLIMVLGIASISLADEDPMLIAEREAEIIPYNWPHAISVQNNGEYVDFTDGEGNIVPPQIINNRTMVPFRKIFNALGVKDENISWDGETKKVVAKKDNLEIELQIDNPIAKKIVSGDANEIKLDSAPVIVDGRTLVPVRFIAESMNKKVGWDAENRVVIIIDTSELKADLEKAVPKFIEIANAEVEMPETYDMNMKLTGTMEYKDKDNKDNNTTINLTGTLDLKKGEAMIEMDTDAKLSGKGPLYNVVSEAGFDKFDFDLIAEDNKVFIKSSLLDEKTKGKWAVVEDDSIKTAFATLNKTQTSLDDIFDIKEEDMNLYTYESLKLTTSLLKAMCKDENIKITEKGTTKTYTINMDLKEILEAYKDLGIEMPTSNMTGNVKSVATYKNNVAQDSEGELKFDYKEGNESISLVIKLDSKISSKDVKISLPSDSQVVKADELN